MPVRLPALVVFDLAGTTVRDEGQVPTAFTEALAAHGIRVTAEEVAAVRGSSKREAILSLLPAGPERERRAAEVFETFRARLSELYGRGVREVPGAEELFRKLRARGVRVALDTGFDRATTELLLRALGWDRGLADAVVTGDDVARGRPAPDLILRAMESTGIARTEDVANVGDTVLDLRAAQAAGVAWNIGVLTGAHGRESLEKEPHTQLVDSVADLGALWAL
jgi:phosphonatase-like hydrolase